MFRDGARRHIAAARVGGACTRLLEAACFGLGLELCVRPLKWPLLTGAAEYVQSLGCGWVCPRCCGLACVPRTRQRCLAACNWHRATVTSASCVCLDWRGDL